MPPRRQPLGEATSRVNNSQDRPAPPKSKISAPLPHHESYRPGALLQGHTHTTHPRRSPLFQVESHSVQDRVDINSFASSRAAARRSTVISNDFRPPDPKRYSDLSTSTDGSGRQKKDIGPWNLGKTLGEGSTARVRKARHRITGALAAVKIVQKKDARMSQAGSLAALDHLEALATDTDDELRCMPLGIEREVAIMKLIEHPHIMRLHDIWENRMEIYLILEFVDRGELFDYITDNGKLPEVEGMKYWRQILSAVGYCHSFNICHRDLKPENILLTRDGNIKIADFGMAALTQTRDHRLNTSCGSPHYAAPEIISGARYDGNKVDIWSMGVILFAILSGTLPFDHPGPGLQPLLALVRRGRFEMRPEFSFHAKDLIARLLRVPPEERLTIKQIWKHPLLRKYDHLDRLNTGDDNSTPFEVHGEPLKTAIDIDRSLLRHLRSLWHMFDEPMLVEKLLEDGPNEQKRFYYLLVRYRDRQRENYIPELEYSSSDYHHARPLNQVRKLSTRQFIQPTQNGHGHQISRFTVVGNGSKNPAASGYNPREAPNPSEINLRYPHLPTSRPDKTDSSNRKSSTGGLLQVPQIRALQASSVSVSSSMNSRGRPPTRRGFTTRSSLASSTRSRGSTSGVVKATVGHKRGVSFSHARRPSPNDIPPPFATQHPGRDFLPAEGGDEVSELRSHVGGDGGGRIVSGRYIRSRKTTGALLQPVMKRKSTRRSNRFSRLWEDDVRQVSNSLEKDCDEAFYLDSPDVAQKPAEIGLEFKSKIRSAQFSTFQPEDTRVVSSPRLPRNLQVTSGKAWWDQRPLPRPPARSESVDIELAEARRYAESRKATGNVDESTGYLDQKISHIDRLQHPTSSPFHPHRDRRIRSAPVPRNGDASRVLAPIKESSIDGMTVRSGSDSETQALQPAPAEFDDRTSRRDARIFQPSIRIVPESSPVSSPIKPTAPLRIKKQSRKNAEPALMTGALGAEPGQEHRSYEYNRKLAQDKNLPRIDEHDDADEPYDENSNGTVRHKGVWFKRPTRASNEDNMPLAHDSAETIKKKGFGLSTLFKKRSSRNDPAMAIALDVEDTISISQQSFTQGTQHAKLDSKRAKDLKAHQAEPHQNWLARLFKVKPIKKHVCCAVSRRRARQEINTIFREWRRYGLTDIVIDKERNIIYARIRTPNSLQIKEVSFAAEVMAVIEHGTRNPLSIVRLTQERGAASSLVCVAEKLTSTMKERGMLVSDKRKAKMMIKTLNSGDQV